MSQSYQGYQTNQVQYEQAEDMMKAYTSKEGSEESGILNNVPTISLLP